MIEPVALAGVFAVIGGVLAVTARDVRLVAIGIVVAMVFAQLTSASQPTALAIAFRILGSLLAAYVLWASAGPRSIRSQGAGIGPVAEFAAAAAAFSVGWFVEPVKPLTGPVAAQAAGIALVAVSVVPLAGRDVFRLGAGVAVLVVGGSLLSEAWVGPASSLGQILVTALVVGIVGATSVLISPFDAPAARRVGLPGDDAERETAGESRQADADQPVESSHAATVEPDAAAAEATKATGRLAAGPMATRKPSAKQPRKSAAEKAVSEKAVSDKPAQRAAPQPPEVPGPRVRSVRVSPTRSVRDTGQAGSGQRVDEGSYEEDSDLGPETLPRSTSITNRVRRLRPREPRK